MLITSEITNYWKNVEDAFTLSAQNMEKTFYMNEIQAKIYIYLWKKQQHFNYIFIELELDNSLFQQLIYINTYERR